MNLFSFVITAGVVIAAVCTIELWYYMIPKNIYGFFYDADIAKDRGDEEVDSSKLAEKFVEYIHEGDDRVEQGK